MKTFIWTFLLCLFCISCSGGTKSDILGLPYGIEYSKAKEIIIKTGLEIKEENSNQNDSEDLKKYGLRSSFSVDSKYGSDDAKYTLSFHSNKLVGGLIRIDYPDTQKLERKSIEIKNKLIREFGNPKNETNSMSAWEKNNLFIFLASMDLSSIDTYYNILNYQNENYYNQEILARYKMLEDTWKVSIYPKEYRIIFSNGQMVNETYERNKLIKKGEPIPYILSGNKIRAVDENGILIEEMEYILDRNTLKITFADGDKMDFIRVP
ncbi:hypothetical protein K7I13_05285 [Brucepastera parasyntrophica]|uniref:hypothetical protein n=1 Tax=Brucepastera parasyntrophica TaxID=2880008 RepID=UPI002108BD26|nr:hypothetical protein [Brucepastera parasyntrophica]ULQ60687.1 hypothetical protein K7I13_05285 [Brucepastera parasyntrophica]